MQLESSNPEISVIIPAYNEAKRILPTLSSTSVYLKENFKDFEIIVIDDGSKDETIPIIEKFNSEGNKVKIIPLGTNKGKGAAVREGMLAAQGSLLLFQDADGATPVAELKKLIEVIKQCDVAIGSRALPSADTTVTTIIHRKLLGRIFNFTANLLAVPGILDTQCGFKLFTNASAKKIFSEQKLNGFGFDVEVLFLARKMGFKVIEVAVNWHNMPGTKVNVVLDGIKMFFDILRIRLLHR